jgi:hypothetical protein
MDLYLRLALLARAKQPQSAMQVLPVVSRLAPPPCTDILLSYALDLVVGGRVSQQQSSSFQPSHLDSLSIQVESESELVLAAAAAAAAEQRSVLGWTCLLNSDSRRIDPSLLQVAHAGDGSLPPARGNRACECVAL